MQIITEADVLATYNRKDPTSEELVADYREYQDYTQEHPDEGPTLISRALDMPLGRIKEWHNGVQPDGYRAISFLDENGWFDAMPASTTNSINRLIAWLLASGCVQTQGFRPRFTLHDSEDIYRLSSGLRNLGLKHDVQHREGRPDEVTIPEWSSVAGRAFAAAGVPIGNDHYQVDTLPGYLNYATTTMRRVFIEIFLLTRAGEAPEPWATKIELRPTRPATYIDDFETLCRQEGGRSHVERAGRDIFFSPVALERITEES
ncbi:hypothetical protein [Halorubellus sp. PRR65]|uniref:hypothetical protein n=1 Tax=Halorubellus sp. PRR65 TaxID=3098148 RepID=UPI002B26414F|nr:hypothetical protein [Halorubellus sp. PRR65]